MVENVKPNSVREFYLFIVLIAPLYNSCLFIARMKASMLKILHLVSFCPVKKHSQNTVLFHFVLLKGTLSKYCLVSFCLVKKHSLKILSCVVLSC